jgi:hypothetical protein
MIAVCRFLFDSLPFVGRRWSWLDAISLSLIAADLSVYGAAILLFGHPRRSAVPTGVALLAVAWIVGWHVRRRRRDLKRPFWRSIPSPPHQESEK